MPLENALGALRDLTEQELERKMNALMLAAPQIPTGGYMPGASPVFRGSIRPLEGGETRPNDDGSYSTELLATEYLPDGSVGNFPTLWMGGEGPVELDPYDALDSALAYEAETGMQMPRFASINEAERHARQRSMMGGLSVGPLFERR